MADNEQKQGVQTTGHVWDGDLQEYNNPLPVWWTYTFYVTILFAIVYWVTYPSWPVGKGFMSGVGQIEYVNAEGQTEAWHWNTRAKLLKETQDAAAEKKVYFDRIASLPYDQVAKDPELSSFVQSAGKAIFADNCAACHQTGGAGKIGFYPNLTDDNWIHGCDFETIAKNITTGFPEKGMLPYGSGTKLSDAELSQVASYIVYKRGSNPPDPKPLEEGRDKPCPGS